MKYNTNHYRHLFYHYVSTSPIFLKIIISSIYLTPNVAWNVTANSKNGKIPFSGSHQLAIRQGSLFGDATNKKYYPLLVVKLKRTRT
jgi:hypothetical protein